MVTIPQLWLSILVSAAVAVVAAGIAWSVLPRPGRAPAAAPLGRDLALMAAYALVVSIFVAYVAGRAVPPGAEYKEVFRFAATVGVLSYAGGHVLSAIRGGLSWEAAVRNTAIGAVLGLLAGGPFAAFWPGR